MNSESSLALLQSIPHTPYPTQNPSQNAALVHQVSISITIHPSIFHPNSLWLHGLQSAISNKILNETILTAILNNCINQFEMIEFSEFISLFSLVAVKYPAVFNCLFCAVIDACVSTVVDDPRLLKALERACRGWKGWLEWCDWCSGLLSHLVDDAASQRVCYDLACLIVRCLYQAQHGKRHERSLKMVCELLI